MGRKGSAVDKLYANHLNGGRFSNNPARNMQQLLENMHFNNLTELCANRFEWTGLPDSVNVRFLEMQLVYKALAVIYKDEDTDKILAVAAAGAGHTNFNDEPVAFTVIGPGRGAGKQLTLTSIATRDDKDPDKQLPPQCVPVWANYTRVPELDVISVYAYKLAKLDRTIEITMDGMRKNKIVKAPENQRTSYVNIMRQIDEGQPVIFGTENLDLTASVEVLDLSIDPMNLPNLMIAKSKLWNECMGYLGINNSNQDKKERLVAAEVGANDEQVQASRNVALNARQRAAEQISDLYGLTVTVDFKTPPPIPTDAPGAEFVTGGGTSSDNQGAGAN